MAIQERNQELVNLLEPDFFRRIPESITNADLAPMPALTIKGNDTNATAQPDDLTSSEVVSMLTANVATWTIDEVNTSLITGVSGGITIKAGIGANGSRFDPTYGTLLIEPPSTSARDAKLYVYNSGNRTHHVITDGPSGSDISLAFQTNSTTRAYFQWLNSTLGATLANSYGQLTLSPGASGTATPMLELTTTGAEFNDQLTIDQNNTGRHGIVVDMPSSTAGNALIAQYNGTDALLFRVRADQNRVLLPDRNLGNNVAGSGMVIGRNSNAGAEGGAPGYLNLMRANGNAGVIYPDNSNVLRIHNTLPTGSTGTPTVDITAGTVVGSQTSHISRKIILGDAIDPAEALQNIMESAGQVKRFMYRGGEFGFEAFEGIVLSGPVKHRYGMDADPLHPAGKSLNVITLHGDQILAITELGNRSDRHERHLQQIAQHLGITLN